MPQKQQQGGKVRLTLMVDKDVIRKAKARAAFNEQALSEVVETLLNDWLKVNGQGRQAGEVGK